MKSAVVFAVVLWAAIPGWAQSPSDRVSELINKYRINDREFEFKQGKFISKVTANQIDTSSYAIGDTKRITFKPEKFETDQGWRLTEVSTDTRLATVVASTATFVPGGLRRVTRCYGFKKDGLPDGNLSCATASPVMCKRVNQFFDWSTSSARGKEKLRSAGMSAEAIESLDQAQKTAGGMSGLASACYAYAQYASVVNRQAVNGVVDLHLERAWDSYAKDDKEALEKEIKKMEKWPSKLGFKSINLEGQSIAETDDRADRLAGASRDLLATASLLEMCRESSPDFSDGGSSTGRPAAAGTATK